MKELLYLLVMMVFFGAQPVFAEIARGVVTQHGFTSIKVKVEGSGEVKRFFMGRGMHYLPEDFRAYSNDKVEITYKMSYSRKAGEDVPYIELLKMVEQDESNLAPSSPQEGRIEEAGRKRIRVFIPKLRRAITFERARGTPKVENAMEKPTAGNYVRVFFNRVASKRGNSYAYLLHGFQSMP